MYTLELAWRSDCNLPIGKIATLVTNPATLTQLLEFISEGIPSHVCRQSVNRIYSMQFMPGMGYPYINRMTGWDVGYVHKNQPIFPNSFILLGKKSWFDIQTFYELEKK